ncbi:hypothetical protein [Streptomyces tricolor]|uniref:hypothetical protein n=1 Tax=Streptomyces tricolor TaxID=68277 RepID=UPI0036EDBA30
MRDLVKDLLAEPMLREQLELATSDRATRTLPSGLDLPDPADMPVVEVGTPYAEKVAERGPDVVLFVAMACSFRPVPGRVAVAWARFAAHSHPDPSGHSPEVRGLYPDQVEDEVRVARQLGVSPELTFAAIGTGIGGFQRTVEFTRLDPSISAAGLHTSTASWDYNQTAIHRIAGAKLMCALVRAPAALAALDVSVAVSADLDLKGLRLPAWLGGRRPDPNDSARHTAWRAHDSG